MAVTQKQIAELEEFFAKAKIPKSVALSEGITITDTAQFIESHLKVLRNNGDKQMYEVFYTRLMQLKVITS